MAFYVQWRHKWAEGPETWQYKDFSFFGEEIPESRDAVLQEYFDGLTRSNDWSDKYRGIQWETIENPPVEWLQEQITRSISSKNYHQRRIKRLTAKIAEQSVEVPSDPTPQKTT